MKDTKRLSISALMAAMCVAVMSLGSIVETMDFSLSILAGLIVMILASEYGNKTALSVFAVAGLLSMLLPVKSPAVCFLAFFGWYPVAQKRLNMLKSLLSRFVKTLLFNLSFGLVLLLSALLTGTAEALWMYATLAVLGNVCFVLYDILLDRFLIWYLLKLRNRLRF
ncbi:MAG: hypothetical protein IKC69_07710 [Clostridia bacterium]|nr:hypothetical protein [Clostridia bacterium]